MKERVYGWYPPAQDIYTAPRDRQTYQKECLYRHMRSRYADKEGVGTPQPPTPIKMTLSPRPDRKSTSPVRPTTAVTPKQTPSASPSPPGKQVRIKSAPVNLTPKPPAKAWSMYIPETKFSPIPTPFSPDENPFESRSSKPERVQSATIRRDRVTPPKRTIKSAGPVRPPVDASQTAKICRPWAPEPPRSGSTKAFGPSPALSPETFTEGPEPLVDFDEQLDRFGWRMQVHGDPLQLKTPTFHKRMPYSVKCSGAPLPPKPPKIHMESKETFFYNTIPRKPLSCVIHPEWISEILHAKRMELQKRDGGVNYRYKNFSFIY